jgi:hypothetical protein
MFIFVKGFLIYDGTMREASVAGTHATRLDRVSPYWGFRKLLPAGRGWTDRDHNLD